MVIYVANRGEIARRVARTARKLGHQVAVGYADQDQDLPFVKEADIAIPLSGEEARDTYLNIPKVIEAAQKSGAHLLHPGYGFLSENPEFVSALSKTKIKFLGPSAEAMKLLGDKIGARHFLKDLGVPLLPSYDEDDQSDEALEKAAKKLGYPLLIKPSAGGGGKGMVRVHSHKDFLEGLASSRRIAKSAFSDDRVFLERYIENARHIEVQVLGDEHGHVSTFGIRECSLQRRHQKVFEETPCEFLATKLRKEIEKKSQKLIKAANYQSAGTVEWIWDGSDGVYFLEVNSRLQVEHPVTELVYDVDLVEWQIRIAQGEKLRSLKSTPRGHAIEARVCAEDPSREFLPSGGKIHKLSLPKNVRVDFGFAEKNSVPPQFDSLMGKVISFGSSREEAISNLIRALKETIIMGPTTNRAYLIKVLQDSRVQKGEIHTGLLGDLKFEVNSAELSTQLKELQSTRRAEDDADLYSPWGRPRGLPSSDESFSVDEYAGRRFYFLPEADWSTEVKKSKVTSMGGADASLQNSLKSPMPAKVVKAIAVKGKEYQKGDLLFVIEAMKMEHQLKAPRSLKIKDVRVREGDRVMIDDVLAEWE